ncbi:hypothetical protein K501DRAFT_290969 [Backusella circina FSU 941]|nr:hypothetical protein K501DRAFT_290969 [Backusella circina FSU 941]
MSHPRSDLGHLKKKNVLFHLENDKVKSMTLHFRFPKEKKKQHQVKTFSLGLWDNISILSCSYGLYFSQRITSCRTSLNTGHTFFLVNLTGSVPVASIRPAILAFWLEFVMRFAGTDTSVYKPHSLCSASSTKAVEIGISIDQSRNACIFEEYYYKPITRSTAKAQVTFSVFSSIEDSTTLDVGVESIHLVIDTTYNSTVNKMETENMVGSCP